MGFTKLDFGLSCDPIWGEQMCCVPPGEVRHTTKAAQSMANLNLCSH